MNKHENKYRRARIRASKHNDRLCSRLGAADALNISESQLGDYERGLTKIIPPENVVRMADEYNAPELLTSYCIDDCPIHGFLNMTTGEDGIDLPCTTLKLRRLIREMVDMLPNIERISEDGAVSENEKCKFKIFVDKLDEVTYAASEMKLILKTLNG